MFRFVSCCAVLLVCSVAQGAMLVNGDFETGDLTGWTVTQVPENQASIAVEDGRTVVRIDGTIWNEPIGLTLSQEFTIASKSTLSFDWEFAFEGSDPLVGITAKAAGLVENRFLIAGVATGGVWAVPQRSETVAYTLTAGTYTIQFTMHRMSGIDPIPSISSYGFAAIDNVAIVEVPEPSTIALLLLGAITHLGILRSSRASKR
jgi:hypothetical protein